MKGGVKMKTFEVSVTDLNPSTWELEWVTLAVVSAETQRSALEITIRNLKANPDYREIRKVGEDLTAKYAGEEVKISLFPVDVWQ